MVIPSIKLVAEEIKNRDEKQFYIDTIERDKHNRNMFSNWYPRIHNRIENKFNVPYSYYFKLPYEIFKLMTLGYKTTNIEEIDYVNDYFDKQRIEGKLSYPLFMKNGLFSNKFEYNNCIILSKEEFYDKIYNIYYASLCVGAEPTTEIVLREIVPTVYTHTIYDGTPMRVEYRAFVDFDNKKLIDVIDYWHPTIVNTLFEDNDKRVFTIAKQYNQKIYDRNLGKVKEAIEDILKNTLINLDGIYSVDFILDYRENLWLIDMALAKNSWGFNLILKNQEE